MTEGQHLRNLLARIHRDGGHYLEEHGLEKAVAVADRVVAELHAKDDERSVLTGNRIATDGLIALALDQVERLALEGFSRGWDDIDADDRTTKVKGLVDSIRKVLTT